MKKIAFSLCCLFVISVSCGGKKAPDMMDKLRYILSELENSSNMRHYDNESALRVLRTNVRNTLGYTPEGVKLTQSVEILRRKTDSLVQYIERCKKNIAREIGKSTDGTSYGLKSPQETSGLYDLMTNTQEEYNAKNLKKALDAHISYLNQHFGEYFSYAFYSLTDTPQKMDFAMCHFSNTSVIIALSMLTNFQLDILRHERECIRKLTPDNESRGFEWIYPIVEVESSKIQEGDEYVARIRLVKEPVTQLRRVFANGIPVKVNAQGVGEVRWKVTGKGKQTWKGEIKTRIRGIDTTFVVYPTYEVIPRTK